MSNPFAISTLLFLLRVMDKNNQYEISASELDKAIGIKSDCTRTKGLNVLRLTNIVKVVINNRTGILKFSVNINAYGYSNVTDRRMGLCFSEALNFDVIDSQGFIDKSKLANFRARKNSKASRGAV
ncbi:hypothetical protein [Pseudomonas coronafaciens]|uniref:hypothetical protein n=1 Tax=Pseudomonas coronafaciens TaxID=53409 RepID=UPI0011C4815C|nr:hypothetical protein [Pseudomonas coronafaciens]